MLALRSALRSDTGRRADNEDAVCASPRLAAVADGVGGHAALALERGSGDNVSVVVADVTVPRDPSVAWQPALTL
jgi:serine/threonine protein phosphatase PrpC